MKECNCKPNKCIKCNVANCEHHCGKENYCSLSEIKVETHESNPTEPKCTDCSSFSLKK